VRLLTHAAAATVFLVLATLNSGGYRYGAADQAFYIPAILEQLDPALYPRDSALVGPQARYFFVDEIVASVMRRTGWSIETWFATGYVVTLVVLYAALWRLGQQLFRSPYAPWALLAAETLRHRIARTGVNTLEGYFHPRVLVFAIGVWAIGTYLRGRTLPALAAIVLGGLLHPTTAAFFVVFLVPAIWVTDPSARRWLGALITLGTVGLSWLLLAGPLRNALAPMDPDWRALLASKDYLFPASDWGLDAWAVNLGVAALAIGTLAVRVASGRSTPREEGLLAGTVVLTLGFLVTLPAVTAGWALLVQLQISRVFWLLDLLATVSLIWWLLEWRPRTAEVSARLGRGLVALLMIAAAARGLWSTLVEHPERPLVVFSLPGDDWTHVIEWASAQPARTHLLADPGHAFRYGTPLRYSGRDVFLEEVKDTAMAIYSRASAARVIERQAALGDFASLDAERSRELARRYRLDYLVIDRDLLLPEVQRVGGFRIYSLR
jgi:hypothetical protein